MINNLGHWEYDPADMNEDNWCDMDYIAHWLIDEMHYEPKYGIKNMIENILDAYDSTEEIRKRGYYVLRDPRPYPENLMIYVPDVDEFVRDSGGLVEFDWEC